MPSHGGVVENPDTDLVSRTVSFPALLGIRTSSIRPARPATDGCFRSHGGGVGA
jgi:hypothetical protein